MGIETFEPDITLQKNERTLVTFFLISYNQERFIREALEGAFSQTYQPLEIVLSDDCSTDNTFKIMRQMVLEYKGPHKVVLNQNDQNLGLCGNVNRILDLASGEIIVIAAGDDISLPDRVQKSYNILEKNPDANSVSFQLQIIDENGVPEPRRISSLVNLDKCTLSEFIDNKCTHFHGASRTFRKSVYVYFGPLSRNAATEDSTTFLRCIMMGSAYCSSDVGVYYRVHGDNYYSSDKRHLINYKRIYWQYLKDIEFAVRKGVISSNEAHHLKHIYKRKLQKNLLITGYHLTENRFRYYYSRILFSPVCGFKEKAYYFRDAFRAVSKGL
jgi:glycosyltransferase involved in cell wall biosynthesis